MKKQKPAKEKKAAKQKKKVSKERKVKRPIRTQEPKPACLNPVADYLPISKIENGIIYTKDHRYVKVVEVVPINFMNYSTARIICLIPYSERDWAFVSKALAAAFNSPSVISFVRIANSSIP